jgi:hypothetical protein
MFAGLESDEESEAVSAQAKNKKNKKNKKETKHVAAVPEVKKDEELRSLAFKKKGKKQSVSILHPRTEVSKHVLGQNAHIEVAQVVPEVQPQAEPQSQPVAALAVPDAVIFELQQIRAENAMLRYNLHAESVQKAHFASELMRLSQNCAMLQQQVLDSTTRTTQLHEDLVQTQLSLQAAQTQLQASLDRERDLMQITEEWKTVTTRPGTKTDTLKQPRPATGQFAVLSPSAAPPGFMTGTASGLVKPSKHKTQKAGKPATGKYASDADTVSDWRARKDKAAAPAASPRGHDGAEKRAADTGAGDAGASGAVPSD